MNPNVRAQNLIGLMEELVDLLERENALLERPRARELGPVVEEKQALFKLYEEQINAIAEEGSAFGAALEPDLRERLRATGERFDDLARINERKLKVMTASSQHIVDRIADAARRAAGQVQSYGRSGAAGGGTLQPAPVALNRDC